MFVIVVILFFGPLFLYYGPVHSIEAPVRPQRRTLRNASIEALLVRILRCVSCSCGHALKGCSLSSVYVMPLCS